MTIPKQLLNAKICNKEKCADLEYVNKKLSELNDFIIDKNDLIKQKQEFIELCLRKDKVYSDLEDKYIELKEENEKIKKMYLSEHKYASDMEGKYIIEKVKKDEAINYIDQVLQYDLSTNDKKKIDEDINTLIGILIGSDKQ